MTSPTYEELLARVASLETQLAEAHGARAPAEQLSVVVRQSPGVVWIVDRDLRFTLSDGGGLTRLGLVPGQVVGMSLCEYFQTDEDGLPIRAHRRALAGESVQFSIDFDEKVYDAYVEPFRGVEGDVSGAIGFALDVTERVRAEDALAENEARLEAIFESSPYSITATDLTGTVTKCNRAMRALHGYDSEDEVLGISALGLIAPEDRERAAENLRRTLEEGRVDDVEYTMLTRDGDRFPGELSAAVGRDREGRPTSLVAIVKDIRERVRAEEDLRLRDLAMASSLEGIAFASFDLRLTYVNGSFARLWGYERPAEVLGRSPLEFWEDPAAAEHVVEAIGRDGHWRGDLVGRRKDGSTVDVHVRASIARDRTGRPLAMMASFEDVTERKRAEERQQRLEAQLQQAQKMEMVGRLAGGIAHDFNNLLTVIIGSTELALSRLEMGDEFFDELDQVRDTAARAAELTSQLLAFSRQQIAEPKVVDLNERIAGTRRMLGRLIGEDIRLVLRPEPGLWPVKADPGQIDQVVTNLVVNARDAMPDGGDLVIETHNTTLDAVAVEGEPGGRPGEYVLLTVRDSGSGMDEETRRRIFEPFFTTKERGKGTGLGLATCYGIVKQNEGLIHVSSELGSGTTFSIFLPRTVDVANARPAPPGGTPDGLERVLVVEDEPAVRDVVVRILESRGYRVESAGRAADALALAERLPGGPDVLLTDVIMPEMGGKALAELLLARFPAMSVLYMSGYMDESIARRGLLAPGVALLQKPFTPTRLLQKIREVLDTRARATP